MHGNLKTKLLNACSWSGLIVLGVTLAGWLVAGVLPLPLGPSDSTGEVVEFYADGGARRTAGFVIATLGIAFYIPFVAVITLHMLRIEGRLPILAFIQLVAGTVAAVLLLVPMLFFAILSFRPDSLDDSVIGFFNDLTWLLFLTPIVPFMIQNVAIGLCILTDARETFPRWIGFVNLFVALSFTPDVLAYFFFSGPFGWSGIFIFWLALTTFSVFLVVMAFATRKVNVVSEATSANAAAI